MPLVKLIEVEGAGMVCFVYIIWCCLIVPVHAQLVGKGNRVQTSITGLIIHHTNICTSKMLLFNNQNGHDFEYTSGFGPWHNAIEIKR